ncbi:hypothetical protein [Erwinia sp. HR93]|uniref:hypothetical protein n=1 Tax=Erwinia sp. HR93 TaxID=3094840 RepID=UPI002ADEAC5D|nr:hypothetical protein [Erwinia sp. HR93]MEA1062459.1 hypothetical protein [Erwinia sp. HR93]
MRTLNSNELQTVSGAGLFSFIGSKIGGTIANVVANEHAMKGIQDPDGVTIAAGTILGQGIGGIIDNIFNPFRLNKTISDMATGIQLIKLANVITKSQMA